ncbi:hydroxylysine kinase-like [Littorina saxatilis]|uniref:hydroxylysine kinase-like n=1 Tax=Littorina saxatilis TaxID=31220 RepID=UPI0038B5E5DE
MSSEQGGEDNSAGTEIYRPELSPSTVTQLTLDLYGLHVLSCRELDSYDDRNFHVTVDTSLVKNEHITQVWPHGYVFKVLNSLDSRKPEVTEAKNAMMVHAVERGFPTPRPVPSLSGQLSCLQPLAREHDDQHNVNADCQNQTDKDVYLVRLMEYLPGTTLASVPLTPQLSFQVGHYAAKLDLALKDFDDSNCPELIVNWNMQNVPSLRHLLRFISDAEKASVVRQVIEDFEKKVLKCESGLQKAIIHSDFNVHNILVGPEGNTNTSSSPTLSSTSSSSSNMCVCGILDFGDATKSFLLIEVAIAMTYMTLLCPADLDPDEMSGQALAGYLSEMKLSREEVDLIPLTMCARFCNTLTFGFHRLVLDPGNDYCMVDANKVWPHLQRLWSRSAADTVTLWKRVADQLGVAFPS